MTQYVVKSYKSKYIKIYIRWKQPIKYDIGEMCNRWPGWQLDEGIEVVASSRDVPILSNLNCSGLTSLENVKKKST